MIGQVALAAAVPLFLQAAQTNSGEMTGEQEFQIAMEALKRGGTEDGLTGVLALLVPFALFAMIFGIVWLKYRHKQVQMRARAEFHKQLVDKFSSGREFSEFLESKGGRQFLDEMREQGGGRYAHVLRTMQIGVVSTALGLGMLAFNEEREIAVVILAVGAGFLISSAISYWLSRKWESKADAGTPQVS